MDALKEKKLKREVIPIQDWSEFLNEAKIEFEKLYPLYVDYHCNRSDFEFVKTLGKGGFGRVYLARTIKDNAFYAVKLLDKAKLVKTKQVKHAINEKKILQALNFPLCVFLKFCFKDNSYLYYGLPFVAGGEMFTLLRKMKKFDEPLAKFYAAQVLLAFEYLHHCDMIFRDLKPENVLIDQYGFLKVTDFGFCKIVKGRTYTLCGTPEYLAPEIILNKGYSFAVDWWTFGVLLYEMGAGYPPFHAKDPMKIYEKIVACKYSLPKFFSRDLSDLVQHILEVDLTRRFGNLQNGIKDIKEHPWFQDVEWMAILNGVVAAPYSPNVASPDDSRNFDLYKETTMVVAPNDQYEKDFIEF